MELLKTKRSIANLRPEDMFVRLGEGYGNCWLDSSLSFGDRGRYSFLARNPVGEICLANGAVRSSGVNLRLAPGESVPRYVERVTRKESLFAIGYFGYEATLPWLGLSGKVEPEAIPEARFLFYRSVLRYDHQTGEFGATDPGVDDYSDLLAYDSTVSSPTITGSTKPARVTPRMNRSDYLERVREVKHYIREGDIYQANFTTRFDVTTDISPTDVYRRLRKLNPAPYSAWLDFGDYRILSSSPERMFLRSGNSISTSPIKGTIARGKTLEEEKQNTKRLLNSEKDRAELLMIVDLERNDLGQIARTGSVRVDSLYHAEKYSSVIHLVSDISARLRDDVDFDGVCRAMMPGGSITGAPKRRAAEIINKLEIQPRSVYTGCVGYVHGGDADFNIAIRTMVLCGDTYHVHAGGGIVADSDPQAEYDEMMLKANNLFRALGANT